MLSRVSARSYSTAAQSVKVLSREAPGNLSTLSVVVNNAGSKNGKSGIAHLLSKYNFLNTEVKSALRFTRESELLGARYNTNVTRDAIILNTSFLREDLPYFVEALGNVLTKTSFRPHELNETVLPVAKAEYHEAIKSNNFVALEALHELTFRRGYGKPLYYDGLSKISVEDIQQYAAEVYNVNNINLVASGVNKEDLTKFIGETSFSELKSGSSTLVETATFQGQESRIRSNGENVAIIGVPVAKADFAKYEVLSASIGNSVLQGVVSPLSKIPGADSQLFKYQDAGLFVVSVSNSDAQVVADGIRSAKQIVQSVTSSQLADSVKAAQLVLALQDSFEFPHDVKVSEASAQQPAKVDNFNYVAVGNTDVLPYANEL